MNDVLFVTLGCDKNRVDSEGLIQELVLSGYPMTEREEDAKAAVVNTCCFINDAKEESIGEILALAEWKKKGSLKALIVTGCMAERYKEEIRKEIPEVDAVLGIEERFRTIQVLRYLLDGVPYEEPMQAHPLIWTSSHRLLNRTLTTTTGYAYLKIAEGCDKHCTYCIIPKLRGPYISVPKEAIFEEACALADVGVKELILVAQETTLYGQDRYGKKCLPQLLEKLCEIEGIRWIRLLYCYPEEVTDELIEVMRTQEKILHYIDLPVQSGSDTVLKRMGRRTNTAQIRTLVKKLRTAMPDICIRTTLITGFPGETREEARQTVDFVEEMQFERLGVFCYSQEEDTPAYSLPDQVTEPAKKMRRARLMKLQQQIAFAHAEQMKGRVLDAIIEGYLPDDDCYVCRTYMDMPENDGYLFLECPEELPRNLMSGTIVRARVRGASGYDLIGTFEDAEPGGVS